MGKRKAYESFELFLIYCPDCIPTEGPIHASGYCYLADSMTALLCPGCRRPMLESYVTIRSPNMDTLVRLLEGTELFQQARSGGAA